MPVLTNTSLVTMPPPAMVKIAICGSRTPSSATLVGVGAMTWICAISSPNSHRVTSTSWTSESRTIISDTNPGSVSLLRCVLCTIRVRPSAPESSSRFSSAYSGSNRRMKPTWTSGRPPLASISTSRSDDALSNVSGFSQRTGFAASRQASDLLLVGEPRRRDDDRVDLVVGDELEGVVDGAHPGEGGGQLSSPLGRRVGHRHQASTVDARGDPFGVVGAHAADAEDADPEEAVAHDASPSAGASNGRCACLCSR